MPSVSVVIPVYNAGRLLERTLASLGAQTYRDFEVVIVDDGSTDAATRALLDAAADRPGTTVHRVANGGPATARNIGITHARADYLLPLDADDYLHPAFLARTTPLLDTDARCAVAYTWVRLVGGHTGIWQTGPLAFPELLARCTVHVTALYRREVWSAVGGYDGRFAAGAEDWDFWISAVAAGFPGACVPEPLAYYHRGLRSREDGARTQAACTEIMRALLSKHRPVYEAHLDEALVALYVERTRLAHSLERVYNIPPLRWIVKAREAWRTARAIP